MFRFYTYIFMDSNANLHTKNIYVPMMIVNNIYRIDRVIFTFIIYMIKNDVLN